MIEPLGALATQYETFADVWQNCSDAHLMIQILDRRKYRNADKLIDFIRAVRDEGVKAIYAEMGEDTHLKSMYDESVELWLEDFDAYPVYTKEQVEALIESGE